MIRAVSSSVLRVNKDIRLKSVFKVEPEIPPAIMVHVTESSINHTRNKLTPSDEQGVESNKLSPEMGWGHLSNINRHGHRCNTCGETGRTGKEIMSLFDITRPKLEAC